jgi:transcriptional regulator with XRE-family HTH domain
MVALSQSNATIRTLDQAQSDLGLSDPEVAEALGVSLETALRWRSARVTPGAEPLRRLRQLSAVATHLNETFVPPGGPRWLRSESNYLGGRRPLDALLAGEFERVEAALEALDSGIFV